MLSTPDWDLDDATLRRGGNIKWTQPPADVLPAWVAEMDVAMPPVVKAALQDALDRNLSGYPADDRHSGLGEATAAFLQRSFGLQVPAERVVSCGDVMAGIRLVLEALCEDAPVVVPTPSYPPFLEIPAVTGRELITVPCLMPQAGSTATSEGLARLDLDGIEAALAAGARTVLLSAPHNPLGRCFTEDELAALRDVVVRHGARVISDEIHAPLVLGGTHIPYSSVPGTEDHVTTVVAASKAWNLPGLKCAQIVPGTERDLATLRAVPHVANHGTSPLGIVATIAAYQDGGPWLDGVLRHLSAQRDLFDDLVAKHLPTVRWTPMQATYLAWVDASGTGLADPGKTALDVGRVMVQPGASFGPGYEQYARINLATSSERLHRIVQALATAWT